MNPKARWETKVSQVGVVYAIICASFIGSAAWPDAPFLAIIGLNLAAAPLGAAVFKWVLL